jgi:hypothetical protein
LRQSELRSDHVDDVTGASLVGGQQLEYAPTDWIPEDVEGVHHRRTVSVSAYIRHTR